jgi:hypothetical protein
MKYVLAAIAFAGLAVAAPAHGADLLALPPTAIHAQCPPMMDSPLLSLASVPQIRAEVDGRYAHSAEVAAAQPVIFSSRPAFTWATEATFACSKAIGYLKSGTVDAQFINKCDCFYGLMLRYLR